MPVTAEARYRSLSGNRAEALSRAKRAAAVTVPKLIVEDGSKNPRRKTPYQGTGARCVNSLAARLLLALLPPNASFFKLSPDDTTIEQIASEVGIEQGKIEAALAKIERTVVNEIETSLMRPVFAEAMKHIIASGNFLVQLPDAGGAKLYPITHYVVDRDEVGNLLEVVTLDRVSPKTLTPEVVAACKVEFDRDSATDPADVALYTRVYLDGGLWRVHQDINGITVPGSLGSYAKDANPWIAPRWSASAGQDYGDGLVYDFIGDLDSLEGLRKAILKAAAAAAKILWLLNPNSSLREKDIAERESGAILRGNASDITAVGLDKLNDIRFAQAEADRIADQLEMVFGVRTAIQRSGERVTAEEIRYLAQELEDNLGGIYSILAEEFLLPLVSRVLDRLQRSKRLPVLPKGLVKARITVGMAALGRGHDLQKLVNFGNAAKSVLGEAVFAQRVNVSEWLARLGAASDIATDGLVLTDEQIAAEQQRQAVMQAGVAAAPNIARGVMPPQGQA